MNEKEEINKQTQIGYKQQNSNSFKQSSLNVQFIMILHARSKWAWLHENLKAILVEKYQIKN